MVLYFFFQIVSRLYTVNYGTVLFLSNSVSSLLLLIMVLYFFFQIVSRLYTVNYGTDTFSFK